MPASSAPLSFREKIAYSLGDAATNFIGQTQVTFLLFFYTDVFGISAGIAGTILLVSRLLDAFNDPIIGALADRTNTRWGRYRPWILLTAVPLAIALVLCYTMPDLDLRGKIIWAVVTYNVMMIFYAANNIPYCALFGVITSDSNQRTSLASWRFMCAMAATLLVNMFTRRLVDFFGQGDTAFGFQITMALWGTVAVVLFFVTFAFTRERIQPSPRQQSSVRQDLADLFHNGPWIALFVLALLIYIQHALRGSATLYYFEYFLTAPPVFAQIDNFGLFNGVGLAVVMLGVALSKPLADRFGKRNTFRVCLLLSAIWMALFALLPRDALGSLFALQVLMQLSFGPTIPLLWAMMADVADYSEWMTGRRSTALAFASIVFGFKLGFGLGGWFGGKLLESVGYVAGREPSPESLFGIVLMVSILPAAALLAGFVALLFYRIDDPLEQQIEQALQKQRAAQDAMGGPDES